MESHNTYNLDNRGMTLVEIIVAISILAIVASLGLFVSIDFAKSYNFRSEKNTIVSLLQRARGESINNINQSRHGVHLEGDPLKYTIFECPPSPPALPCTSYVSNYNDLMISSSYKISVITPPSPSLPFDVIFDQLNGNCVSCSSPITIQVKDASKTYDISVNNEGRIDW